MAKSNREHEGFQITVSLSEAEPMIQQCFDQGLPVVLAGPPAMGKTDLMRRMLTKVLPESIGVDPSDIVHTRGGARPKMGQASYVEFNGNNMDPEDWVYPAFLDGGLNHQVTTSLPCSDGTWLPPKDLGYIFVGVEEIGKKPENLKYYAQLFNERALGSSYEVPTQTYFIATTNNSDDNAGSFHMTSDFISRVVIIQIRNSAEDFLNYHRGDLHPLIVSCIKFNPEKFLFTQKDADIGEPFAGPRTIWKLNGLLNKGLDLDFKPNEALVYGMVGTGATSQLYTMYRCFINLTNLDNWIEDPESHMDEIGELVGFNTAGLKTQYAMVAMLMKKVERDPTIVNKVFPFLELFNNEELEVTFGHMVSVANPKATKEPEYIKHVAKHANDFYF